MVRRTDEVEVPPAPATEAAVFDTVRDPNAVWNDMSAHRGSLRKNAYRSGDAFPKDVSFAMRPSVGTWLCSQIDHSTARGDGTSQSELFAPAALESNHHVDGALAGNNEADQNTQLTIQRSGGARHQFYALYPSVGTWIQGREQLASRGHVRVCASDELPVICDVREFASWNPRVTAKPIDTQIKPEEMKPIDEDYAAPARDAPTERQELEPSSQVMAPGPSETPAELERMKPSNEGMTGGPSHASVTLEEPKMCNAIVAAGLSNALTGVEELKVSTNIAGACAEVRASAHSASPKTSPKLVSFEMTSPGSPPSRPSSSRPVSARLSKPMRRVRIIEEPKPAEKQQPLRVSPLPKASPRTSHSPQIGFHASCSPRSLVTAGPAECRDSDVNLPSDTPSISQASEREPSERCGAQRSHQASTPRRGRPHVAKRIADASSPPLQHEVIAAPATTEHATDPSRSSTAGKSRDAKPHIAGFSRRGLVPRRLSEWPLGRGAPQLEEVVCESASIRPLRPAGFAACAKSAPQARMHRPAPGFESIPKAAPGRCDHSVSQVSASSVGETSNAIALDAHRVGGATALEVSGLHTMTPAVGPATPSAGGPAFVQRCGHENVPSCGSFGEVHDDCSVVSVAAEVGMQTDDLDAHAVPVREDTGYRVLLVNNFDPRQINLARWRNVPLPKSRPTSSEMYVAEARYRFPGALDSSAMAKNAVAQEHPLGKRSRRHDLTLRA